MANLSAWINHRLPVKKFYKNHLSEYMVPKNLNFWYLFGVFSLVVLVNQILTGIWLSMYYTPTEAHAFSSVEFIMRDVHFGWLIRYLHSTGASAFFIVVYLHMYRSIMYGSFKNPRELLWIFGMIIFVFLMIESVSGYALPWGQMSFWAIKVLISVFSVIPYVGEHVVTWLQGGYNVSGVTLHRFFAFHVTALPLMVIFLVFLHIVALHQVGSNNPDGVEIKEHLDDQGQPKDGIAFHPYYTVKDLFGVIVFLIVFLSVVFFEPTVKGFFLEHANFAAANPQVTPAHIAPPWYLAPFYSMLRAVPNKTGGVISAALAIALLFVLPWLDKSPVKSIRYKGVYSKIALCALVISFCGLGLMGVLALTPVNLIIARVFLVIYFLVFITMPFYTKHESHQTPPQRLRCK